MSPNVPGPIPCDQCEGVGWMESERIDIDDVVAKVDTLVLPDKYFRATSVFNCIVPAEYNALTDAQKDYVRMILSLGVCNLNTGSLERATLTSVFGVGTATRANLLALIS